MGGYVGDLVCRFSVLLIAKKVGNGSVVVMAR